MRDFLSQTLARLWDTTDKPCSRNLVLAFHQEGAQNDSGGKLCFHASRILQNESSLPALKQIQLWTTSQALYTPWSISKLVRQTRPNSVRPLRKIRLQAPRGQALTCPGSDP